MKKLYFNKIRILVLGSISICAINSHAQSLSNEALYHRCYAKLTNDVPPKDATYDSVVLRDTNPSLGTDAIEACQNVFSKASFGTGDSIPKPNNVYDPIGKKVLKAMYDLHRTFYAADNLSTVFQFDVIDNPGRMNSNYMDSNSTALYFTKALLREDLPAKYVVTTTESPRAIRESANDNSSTKYAIFLAETSNQYNRKYVGVDQIMGWEKNGTSYKQLVAPNLLPIMPHGLLVGIESDKTNQSSRYYNGKPRDANSWEDLIKTYEISNPPAQKLSSSFGGGFLGNQSFMLLNWGLESRVFVDGAIKTPRRLSVAAYKILFDRSLPLVKASQVTDVVDSNSKIPFRKSSSCMQCHATMDPFAYIYRNKYYGKSINAGEGSNLAMMVHIENNVNVDFSKAAVSLTPELSPWPENDPYFHLRPATGKLFFTNYNGDLMDIPVSSMTQLGLEVAKLDDFYIAIAKRYFQYFTGIDVNISNLDLNPIEDNEFKSKKMEYRNFVIKLGKELKDDPKQSLKELMFKIMRSNAFKYPGKGVE